MSAQTKRDTAPRQPYSCIRCGKPFRSHNPNPQFCSRSCKDQSQITPIDLNRAKSLYDSGASQDEVAAALGVTQKVIWKAFRRAGIKCRPPVKRDQKGEKNSSWRGGQATYSALHVRVEVARGKPSLCEFCGTTEGKFNWANLTGRYEDINDYARLCCSCHRRFDEKRRRESGQLTSAHIPRTRKEVDS